MGPPRRLGGTIACAGRNGQHAQGSGLSESRPEATPQNSKRTARLRACAAHARSVERYAAHAAPTAARPSPPKATTTMMKPAEVHEEPCSSGRAAARQATPKTTTMNPPRRKTKTTTTTPPRSKKSHAQRRRARNSASVGASGASPLRTFSGGPKPMGPGAVYLDWDRWGRRCRLISAASSGTLQIHGLFSVCACRPCTWFMLVSFVPFR